MKYIGAVFLLVFFVLKEVRWLLELAGIQIMNPYILLSLLGLIYIVFYSISLIKEKIKPHRLIWAWLFYLGYQIFVIIINFYWLRSYFSTYDYLTLICSQIISMSMFIIATDDGIYDLIYKYRRILFCLLFVMLLLPTAANIYLSTYTSFSLKETLRHTLRYTFYFAKERNPQFALTHAISYQSFGDAAVIFTFLLLPYLSSAKTRICFLALLLWSIFMLTSKSAIVGSFVSLTFIVLFFIVKRRVHIGKYFAVIMLCVLLAVPVIALQTNVYSEAAVRRLTNLFEKDKSLSLRAVIANHNSNSRPSRILYGNFKHEVQEGRAGSYNHNLFDIIDQFGIFIFIYYIIFLLYLFMKILFLPDANNETLLARTDILCMVYCLVLLLFIRSPLSNAIESFVVGYCCRNIIASKS